VETTKASTQDDKVASAPVEAPASSPNDDNKSDVKKVDAPPRPDAAPQVSAFREFHGELKNGLEIFFGPLRDKLLPTLKALSEQLCDASSSQTARDLLVRLDEHYLQLIRHSENASWDSSKQVQAAHQLVEDKHVELTNSLAGLFKDVVNRIMGVSRRLDSANSSDTPGTLKCLCQLKETQEAMEKMEIAMRGIMASMDSLSEAVATLDAAVDSVSKRCDIMAKHLQGGVPLRPKAPPPPFPAPDVTQTVDPPPPTAPPGQWGQTQAKAAGIQAMPQQMQTLGVPLQQMQTPQTVMWNPATASALPGKVVGPASLGQMTQVAGANQQQAGPKLVNLMVNGESFLVPESVAAALNPRA